MNRQLTNIVRFFTDAFSFVALKLRKLFIKKPHTDLDAILVNKLENKKFPTLAQLMQSGKVFNTREKLIIKTGVLLVLLGISWLGFSYFSSNTVSVPAFGGEYTEGLIGRPLYLNPLLSQANQVDQDLVKLVYNGLVRYDSNYQITPDLAESWKVSEDGKSYTFKIKRGVYWHDGVEFSANDVYFTIQLIKDKAFKSALAVSFEGVEAEISGEEEVTFTLNEPYSGFLNLMTFGILPQHLWYEVPVENAHLAKYNQKPIGTGPYKVESFVKDKSGQIVSYSFKANEDYHLSPAHIENLNFKFYTEDLSAIDALKNKQVQGLGYITKQNVGDLPKRGIQLHNIFRAQFTALFFNSSANTVTKDAKVKEALKLATNKSKLLSELLNDNGFIIQSPILPGFPGYDESLSHEYNPVKAAEVLTADGWAISDIYLNANDEIVEAPKPDAEPDPSITAERVLVKKKTPLVISITTVNQPEYKKLAELIKEDWEQIGIKVKLDIIDRTSFTKETLIQRKYEVLAYGGAVGYQGSPFPYWHSSQREYPGVNLSNYVNRNVDTILEDARKLNDESKITEKYKEFQKILLSDSPAIFLYSPNYTYPVTENVKGITINRINLPSDRFWNVTDWYIKTKNIFKK